MQRGKRVGQIALSDARFRVEIYICELGRIDDWLRSIIYLIY